MKLPSKTMYTEVFLPLKNGGVQKGKSSRNELRAYLNIVQIALTIPGTDAFTSSAERLKTQAPG